MYLTTVPTFGSVVISIYDEDLKLLTMCCTICGSVMNADMSGFDDTDDVEMAFEFEHRDECPVSLKDLKRFH